MDKYMASRVDQDTPRVNPDVARGLAVKHLPHAEEWIDNIWRSVAKDFPPGLAYVGGRRCTPGEELIIEPRKKNDRKIVDIAVSQIYMMRYDFTFMGKPLTPRYMYLPFVGIAGSIILGGSRFFISPVLSDVVLSYELNNVFVRLLRDKFSIYRENHTVIVNGQRDTTAIAWSLIYHVNKDQKREKKISSANTSLVHYLLCKYGFAGMFQRFTKTNPVIGKSEINTETYPEEDWLIFSTYNFGLGRYGASRNTTSPTPVRVAVRKTEMTPLVRNLLIGFFYVTDHFSTRVDPAYVNNPRLWKVLLGHLLFGFACSEGKLHDDADEHINSLSEYIDSFMQHKFRSIGLDVPDIFAFFAIAIEKINEWIMSAPSKINSLYDKELSILYDVLISMTSSIHNLHFKLKTAAKKGLTEKEIENLMNTFIKPKSIISLTRTPPGVSNMSYSGDNAVMKITTVMVPQRGHQGDDGDMEALSDPARHLSFSHAEIGNYNNLPKSNPTGDGRVNPCITLDGNGKAIRNPRFDELRTQIGEMIKHN